MTIRRASDNDLRSLCTTAMRAFHDDPVMRWLYPDDHVYFAPGGSVFQPAMSNWLANAQVWCTDDVAALAVWFPPRFDASADEPAPDEEAGDAAGDHTNARTDTDASPEPDTALQARFALIAPLMAANKPPQPHWYLQLLATHPDWQRQGLGAALMEVSFERADEEGLDCYLETETPANVAYYRRHGFEVRSEWDVDPDGVSGAAGPHMWGMLRPPSAGHTDR